MPAERPTSQSNVEVVDRFVGRVCPNRCGTKAVKWHGSRNWVCHRCNVECVPEEYVTLRAADYDALMGGRRSADSERVQFKHAKWCPRKGEPWNMPGYYCSTCGKKVS